MSKVLGDNPWAVQRRVLESVRDNKRTAVRSCHGIGKSWIASRAALWFLFSRPNSIVATTAPTFRQVELILWQEINRAYKRSPYPLGGVSLLTSIKIRDGWYAVGFSADNPDAAQGFHASGGVLVILDEASGVPAKIWTALDGVLTGNDDRLLSIGNPTDPSGSFCAEFKAPGVAKFAISAYDTPNVQAGETVIPGLVTLGWVQDKEKRWRDKAPSLWKARVLGEFPDAGDATLYPLSWIEAAQNRELVADGVKQLGVDVARFGSDESVIAFRHGPVVRIVHAMQGNDTMTLAGHVAIQYRERGATQAKIDVVGVGGGVVDRCRENGIEVVDLISGSKARDSERFLNAKAEWYWGFREALEAGEVDLDPNDEELLTQLSSIHYYIDSRGKIGIESKDDARKRGVDSPDRAEAIIYAFASVASVPIVEIEIGTSMETNSLWSY